MIVELIIAISIGIFILLFFILLTKYQLAERIVRCLIKTDIERIIKKHGDRNTGKLLDGSKCN